jgi:hypothetical protein
MNGYDEDRFVYNAHTEIEIIIARPVGQVWSQFLDVGSWVTSHEIENVFGTPGTLGSITRVSFKKAKELGLAPPHYHYCKIIKLIPEEHYILKTYTEKEGAYGMHVVGFDDMRFVPLGDQTKIGFNLFAQFRSETIDLAGIAEGSRAGMLVNLNTLKGIVEGRPKT